MKGKKLSVALATTFIAALGMSSCSNVTVNGNKILTLNGYDGKTITVDADTVYNRIKNSEDGVSAYYKAILEVLIRNYFEVSTDQAVKTKLVELKDKANKKVDGVRETANSNANKAGTNYKDEMEALLENTYHVETEEELFNYFLYQLEEEEAKEVYFDNNLGSLTNEYIGFKKDGTEWKPVEDGKHTSTFPYHIKHVLVKTSAEASNLSTSAITSAEAQNLYKVYSKLASGEYTFGEVAYKDSEDSSNTTYGDAGIMNTATSFVSEFKLGTYAFDALYGVTGDSSITKTNYFGLNGAYAHGNKKIYETLADFGLASVPFDVFLRLNEVKDETTSTEGLTVNDGLEKYFPRNIYWNYYLNNHSAFIITDDTMKSMDPVEEESFTKPTVLTTIGKAGFRKVHINGEDKNVLTDEVGRVIYGVRSEFGIHFLVMQRTPFELEGSVISYDSAAGYSYNGVAINDYYTTYTPTDNKYPKDSKTGAEAITYVNWFNTDQTTKLSRAETVKSAVKGFDSMYDYRMYEELIKNATIKIADQDISEEIKSYISNKRDYTKYNDETSVNDTWTSYLDLLNKQKDTREITWKDTQDGADMHRYVNLTCARKFKNYDPSGTDWVKGGACYYAK